MAIVFDGHNDSLTREDHARFASGREGGQLDLPLQLVGGLGLLDQPRVLDRGGRLGGDGLEQVFRLRG